MKGKWHLIVAMLVFIPLWILIPAIQLTDIFYPIVLTILPDIDLKFDSLGHRSVITHSLLIPLIVYVFNPYMVNLLIILSVGIHCSCDVTLKPKRWQGGYTIKVLKIRNPWRGWMVKKSLNGNWSTVWLLSQFLLACGVVMFT